MDKRTRDGRVNRHPGITERNGRCAISYTDAEGQRRQVLTSYPYPGGIEQAKRERNRRAKASPESDQPQTIPLFVELAQIWLDSEDMTPASRRTAKLNLNNHWMPEIGHLPVDKINYAKLKAVIASKQHLAAKTRANLISPIRAIFNLAIESEMVSKNPCAPFGKMKIQKKAIDPFTREERDKILAGLTGNALLFYTIRLFDGLRPGEVIALTWA